MALASYGSLFFAAETGHVEVDKAVFQHLSQNFGSQRGKVFFTACVIREANDLEKIMLVSYVFTRKIIECIFSCVFMCMLCNFSVIFAYLCNFLRLWSKRNQRRNMTQDYPQLSFTMFYIWLGSDTLENIVIYYNYGTGQGATCHGACQEGTFLRNLLEEPLFCIQTESNV